MVSGEAESSVSVMSPRSGFFCCCSLFYVCFILSCFLSWSQQYTFMYYVWHEKIFISYHPQNQKLSFPWNSQENCEVLSSNAGVKKQTNKKPIIVSLLKEISLVFLLFSSNIFIMYMIF